MAFWVKLPLYAAAGVREVWIVNLQDYWLDCYSDPAPRTYRLRERFLLGETIKAELLPELEVNISQIFGK